MLLDSSRASMAASLTHLAGTTITADEIYLTGEVRMAQQQALAGISGPLVITAIESTHLLDLADERPGTAVIGVDAYGRVDLPKISGAMGSSALVVIQGANPEVGTRQPIDRLPALGSGPPLLMDAAQMIGRGPMPTAWSILTAAARDWAGPAGLGILVVRRGTRWQPTTSEVRGWLNGFPNVSAAVGAATSLEELVSHQGEQAARANGFIEQIREFIEGSIDDVQLVGDPIDRLPHILSFSVLYTAGEALVSELARRGISVSSGSACVSEKERPSHVLAAMGAFTGGNVRISLPFGCTEQTIEQFIGALPEAVRAVRDSP